MEKQKGECKNQQQSKVSYRMEIWDFTPNGIKIYTQEEYNANN